jgi:enamine deaminase RidA (YjgF/YER057c/UK114 family)
LKKADTALAGQIANKVAERLQSMFYYLDLNSVGFVKYVVTLSEYITEPRELVSPLQLVETFSNLSIDFNDMSAQRVQRQAEKHIVNIVQILRPELVVAIGGEVKPTTFQAAIKQVIRQFAGMILEKGGLGTKDIYDNSTFFVSLAKALVEEFNLTKKDADISDIAGVIQAELSVSDENIPERRFAGNKGGFNYAMPQLIADTDRLTYQDEARLFTPATIAKLLGVSVDQFLKDAKYEQLIQLVSTFLPAIANPYDGHRVINNRPSPLG